jgi:hypothetical protein
MAFSRSIQGGFFLMKNPLGGRGFETHQLWFCCRAGIAALKRFDPLPHYRLCAGYVGLRPPRLITGQARRRSTMFCGQERDTLSLNRATGAGAIMMLYRGNGSAQIRGPVTGQIYQFARTQPVQPVDPRDVGLLVRTRLFTKVG